MALMLWGTSSNAGKTTLSAGICRLLSRNGMSVAPFKASNLSLNSLVTESGAEIGMGQAVQARACGLEPEADMNPILIKPSGNGIMQTMVGGRMCQRRLSFEEGMEAACSAFDRLSEKHKMIVCEGSGSPAEINISSEDVANIGIVRERPMSIALVSDIERGGVFAAIYGTWLLTPEDVRPLMKGYIINRFRGDPSILGSAFDRILELTGMRCLGIIPYMDVVLPEEDSISLKNIDGICEDMEAMHENAFERLADAIEEGIGIDRLMELIRVSYRPGCPAGPSPRRLCRCGNSSRTARSPEGAPP